MQEVNTKDLLLISDDLISPMIRMDPLIACHYPLSGMKSPQISHLCIGGRSWHPHRGASIIQRKQASAGLAEGKQLEIQESVGGVGSSWMQDMRVYSPEIQSG